MERIQSDERTSNMKAYIIVLIVDGHADTNMYWEYTTFSNDTARVYYDELSASINLDLAKEYLIKNSVEDLELKLVEINI